MRAVRRSNEQLATPGAPLYILPKAIPEGQAAGQALSGGVLSVRIGIHSGPVVAGVIGTKKFSYDLWGDTVNVASRMESHGQAGTIQMSAATYELIQHAFRCGARGRIQVKGKGAMEVWHLLGPKTEPAARHSSNQHQALVSVAR